MSYPIVLRVGCYQFVKVKNFESNSQQFMGVPLTDKAVISLSKLKISKAIHNRAQLLNIRSHAVISLSKLKISKAIHNCSGLQSVDSQAVISLSKLKISKAIHNRQAYTAL